MARFKTCYGALHAKVEGAKVLWELSELSWVKVNTDGASRGNPGRSSFGFVLRDKYGDILHAQVKEIHEGTNTKAEVMAMLEALNFLKTPVLQLLESVQIFVDLKGFEYYLSLSLEDLQFWLTISTPFAFF
uniref:Ribonuclease H-like n=1 Tax=Nicotiana tabacum TaxID=4097 RepID=A0A1S3Z4J7_TOBAC|nr:PREDICTED: ribonuclease H-like [Nicotiana tabacum]